MSQLLILRHAIALDRDEAATLGLSDAERPLTDKGQRRMEQVALGLKRILDKPGLVLSSPLLRARQTAEILAAQYNSLAIDVCEELAPGQSLPQLVKVLAKQQVSGPLVAVGHEPALSTLTGLLLCGREQPFVLLKKAGALLIEFEQRIGNHSGTLQWSLHPKHLRQYAKT